MTKMIPSAQQQAVYTWVETSTGNAVLEAVAGAGKTTTLIEAVRRMKGSVAFAAYNKKIATEIQERLKADGASNSVRAGTFHSFGFSAWRQVAPKVRVDEHKVRDLMVKLSVPETSHAFVRQLVSLAKQYAFGFLTPAEDSASWFRVVEHFSLDELLEETESGVAVEEAIDWARKVLHASVESDKEVIDFDDMIYAPLIHNARVWQNDWVLIDEAQDTNPARRALAKKMLRPGGRLVAVGDPHQAIYGFTGADADSLDIIRREFSAVVLPLTVTYRCPKSVVDMARQWVSHITAHESAPDGSVSSCTSQEFEKRELRPTDAILCRNTKPLVQLAYSLIRRGIPCHVEGREIGRGLLALVNRWKTRSLDALTEKLELYALTEVEKLMAKGHEQQAAGLQDRVDTIIVIAQSLPADSSVNTLREAITKLFDDSEPSAVQRRVVLSTVHKAKGREWDRVWLLGRNKYMPSPYARQEWQAEQEVNLMYVAVTRAKKELIDVVVPAKA